MRYLCIGYTGNFPIVFVVDLFVGYPFLNVREFGHGFLVFDGFVGFDYVGVDILNFALVFFSGDSIEPLLAMCMWRVWVILGS